MEKNNFFSKNLRTWLFAHDKNQAQLGDEIGMTGTAIGKWMLENRPPKGLVLSGFCKHINVDPVEMVNKDLTYQILQDAKYIDNTVADGPDETISYQANSRATQVITHLQHVQTQLKALLSEGEKLLESVK